MAGALESLLVLLDFTFVPDLGGVTTCTKSFAHLSYFSMDSFFSQNLICIRHEYWQLTGGLH